MSVTFPAEIEAIRSKYKGEEGFVRFLKDFCQVMDRDHPTGAKMVPFRLNHAQREFHNVIKRAKAWRRKATSLMRQRDGQTPISDLPIRIIILKARKAGISTFCAARSFWKCEFYNDTRALCMAHQADGARNIGGITRNFHLRFPETDVDFRVPMERDSVNGMKWDPQWGSEMVVKTAGSKGGASRGYTFGLVHASELAFFENSDEYAAALNACAPAHEIYEESTPNGKRGLFYRNWNSSLYIEELEAMLENGELPPPDWSGRVKLFLPWHTDPGYTLPLMPGEEIAIMNSLDEHEQKLLAEYNLTMGQLKWRRQKLANECQNQSQMDPLTYLQQEYSSNPEEAFVSGGSVVFNAQRVQDLEDARPEPVETWVPRRLAATAWALEPDNPNRSPVWQFAKPIPSHHYLIGVDTGEGTPDGADSVISVWDRMDGSGAEEVARAVTKMSGTLIAELAAHLGGLYNRAHIIPERTGVGAAVSLTLGVQLAYPSVYIDHNAERVNSEYGEAFAFGFATSSKSRSFLIGAIAPKFDAGKVVVRHPEALRQWGIFEWRSVTNEPGEPRKAMHPPGDKDDCVMADMLALWGQWGTTAHTMQLRNEVKESMREKATPWWVKARNQKIEKDVKRRKRVRRR